MAERSRDVFDALGEVFAKNVIRRALIREGILPPEPPRAPQRLSDEDDADGR